MLKAFVAKLSALAAAAFPSSTMFGGIEPPASSLLKLGLMLCPEGRVVRRTPLWFNRSMSRL